MSAKNNNNKITPSITSTSLKDEEKKSEDGKKNPIKKPLSIEKIPHIPDEEQESIAPQELADVFARGFFNNQKLALFEPGIAAIILEYYHHPMDRPREDFKTFPSSDARVLHSASKFTQTFEELKTGNIWLGSCSQLGLLLEPFFNDRRHFYEYHTWLGSALYRLLGVTTPERVLSLQVPNVKDIKGISRNACLHVMTEQIPGFIFLDETFTAGGDSKHTFVQNNNRSLPLKGLGAILVSGLVLGDEKILANQSLGYVAKIDTAGEGYAQIVKMEHDVMDMQPKEAIQPAGPQEEKMHRRKRSDKETFPLLPLSVQTEFMQHAFRILQIPVQAYKEIIDKTVCPDGFRQDQAATLLHKILQRKLKIFNEFFELVYSALQSEIQHTQISLLRSSYDNFQNLFEIKKPPLKKEEEKLHLTFSTSKPIVSKLLQQYDQKLSTLNKIIMHLYMAVDPCSLELMPQLHHSFTFQLQENKQFVGRNQQFYEIQQSLDSRLGAHMQVITGMAGSGKTQLAMRYAQLGKESQRYQAVLCLNGECSLDKQFQAVAELWCKKDNLSPKDAVQAVFEWLRNRNTLIVFDKVGNFNSLADYLPTKRGFLDSLLSCDLHFLITSCNPNWDKIPTLTLTDFNVTEARQYIQLHLSSASHSEIDALTDCVSSLPLALAYAVNYIKQGYCTLADYPRQFTQQQLSSQLPLTLARNVTLLSAFLIPILRLQCTHPCTQLILETAAFLAPDKIFSSMLQQKLSENSGYTVQQLKDGISALINQSLLQRNNSSFSIHPLLQKIVYCQLSSNKKNERLVAVIKLVVNTFPVKLLPGEQRKKILAQFLPHFKLLLKHQDKSKRQDDMLLTPLLLLLCENYKNQPEKQYPLLQRILKIQKAHYGDDHPELVDMLVNLALIHFALQDKDSALESARYAYHIMVSNPAYDINYTPMQQHLKTLDSIGITYKDLQVQKTKYFTPSSQTNFYLPARNPPVISSSHVDKSAHDAPSTSVLERKHTGK